MIRTLLFLVAIITAGFFYGCNNNADGFEDEISGTWYTQGKRSTIKVFAEDGKYFGEIVDLKRPLNSEGEQKRDFRNPDPEKRNNLLTGTRVLTGLEYDGDKLWNNVYYYDHKSGEKQEVVVKLKKDGTLSLQVEGMEKPMTWRSEYPVGRQRN